MKSLSEYVYGVVKITTKDKRVVEGEVVSFTSSVESDSGYEEIEIQRPYYRQVFDESEIEKIEVIKEPDFDPFTK